MTPAALTDRVLELARSQFDLAQDALAAEDDLFDSLGIDSVQALELLSRLELEFKVELPDYELAEVRSFAELAGKIGERL